MTKEKALHTFFNSFGLTAYKSTSVPDDVTFPYIVYQGDIGYYDGTPVNVSAQLFYYTESEMIPNAKVQTISDAIGIGGKVIDCDGGHIWVYRGSPWCKSLNDETSPTIKVRSLNFSLKFLTV